MLFDGFQSGKPCGRRNSKPPDADVVLFAQDNGITREEFMWFMHTAPAGFQIMGNHYCGHNQRLLLPDGTLVSGDVLGWENAREMWNTA